MIACYSLGRRVVSQIPSFCFRMFRVSQIRASKCCSTAASSRQSASCSLWIRRPFCSLRSASSWFSCIRSRFVSTTYLLSVVWRCNRCSWFTRWWRAPRRLLYWWSRLCNLRDKFDSCKAFNAVWRLKRTLNCKCWSSLNDSSSDICSFQEIVFKIVN